MKRTYFYWMMSIMALLLLGGCQKESHVQDNSKIQVYTSVYPLQDFATKIGGKHVTVTNLVPPGTEPHDYELTAKEMVKLTKANILLTNGAGLEEWMERAKKNLDSSKTHIVNTSEKVQLSRRNGHIDPHIWLDPQLAKTQASAIRDAFMKADSKHAAEYEANYDKLAKQLDQLDKEYQQMRKNASKRVFVVSHAAFHYLAKRYDLMQIAISGLSPMEEPSPQEVQRVITTVKKYQVNTIFFETLASNRLASVIQKEVGAQASTLNPLEGLTEEELAKGEDYLSIMRKNKVNLAKALGA